MRRIGFIVAPIVLAVALFAGGSWLGKNIISIVHAVSVPVTYSSGAVLTAAQLNSSNNAIYNSFNAHDHSGGEGEPSTLSFTGNDASFTQSGDITLDASGASLECDGTTATDLLLDQGNYDTFFGDGTASSGTVDVVIRADGGDAALGLKVNNATANEWTIRNDNSDSDHLEFEYNATTGVEFQTDGDINVIGGIATDDQGTPIAWETYSGTTCAYTTGSCITDIDTSAPGSGAPLSISCMVQGTIDYDVVGSRSTSSSGGSRCAVAYYDVSSDDISFNFTGISSCGDGQWSEAPYKCIVFYIP